MNAKNLLAAAALLAAGTAFAGEAQTFPYVDFSQVGVTRIQVAQAAPDARNTDVAEAKPVSAAKTRAEVRAELARDYANGNYASTREEFVDFSNVATKAREAAANEAQAAKDAAKIGG